MVKKIFTCMAAIIFSCGVGYGSELDDQFKWKPVSQEDFFDAESYWPQRSVMFGMQFFTPEYVSVWEDQHIYGGDIHDGVGDLVKGISKLFNAMDAVARHFDKKRVKMK
jgi:hypothetical protein